MRAAFVTEHGSADVIRYGELPDPVPGPTDVLVDVHATTVNPVDTFVRSGAYRTLTPFPFVVSRDLVGEVAAVGEGAGGFEVGERVWCNSLGHDGRQGAAAERAVVPVERLYPLPDGVDEAEAVAVLHPAATAYLALFAHGGLRAGETVLVLGGGGNVGSALITLAVDAGGRVVATASARDLEYCRGLGAAEALDYRDPALGKALRAACPDGVDLHLDTSGTNDLEAAAGLLARRGRVVLLAGIAARPVFPVGAYYMNDCSVRGFVISHATSDELAEAARTINRLLASGALRPRAIERQPLSAMAATHARLEAGELHGRRAVLRV